MLKIVTAYFERNIFIALKITMAEKRQSFDNQLSVPDVNLKQLLTNYTEQTSQKEADFNGFRELGKKIPECIRRLPPRARPMLQDVVKLYDKVNYTMRIGLGKSSTLLMKFVVKGLQVYRYDQEADKTELLQITSKIDQKFLKELVVFAEDSKDKFFAIFNELLKIGGSDTFKNLIEEREKLENKIEEISNNILSLTRKLRHEEGELEYFNFEIDTNSKDSEERKLLKNKLEKQVEYLNNQLPLFQKKLLDSDKIVYDTDEKSILKIFFKREIKTNAKLNPVHAAAQKDVDDLFNKINALNNTLKNWDDTNQEKKSKFKEKAFIANQNVEQYKAELVNINADRDQKMAELQKLIKKMEDEYNGSSPQNIEALKMVDDLATTINKGITFLTEDFSKIIIETDSVVDTSSMNDKFMLSLSLPAALEIIGFADLYNNSRMIERLRVQMASADI